MFSIKQLEKRSSLPTTSTTSNRTVELNLNNEQLLAIDIDLFSSHSEYFQRLFHGPYLERNQTIISFHLPESIPIESFVYLNHFLMHQDEPIDLKQTDNLIHLCDKYLFDYLPYQLVLHLFKQFQNGQLADEINEFISKPNLSSTLIQTCFFYLLTNEMKTNQDLFVKLMVNYSNELKILIQSIIKHQSWFQS